MTGITQIPSRILLVGANGKVGKAVRRVFEAEFSDKVSLSCVSRSGFSGTQWALGQSMDALPRSDVVLACWGVTRGDKAALDANTKLANAAYDIARHTGAKRVIHCSSVAVYDVSVPNLQEDMQLAPQNAYGKSKVEMEQAIQNHHDVQSIILRIGNVAGADSLGKAMMQRAPVELDQWPDGNGPRRAYISPSDLARVMAEASLRGSTPVLNVSAAVLGMDALAKSAGCSVSYRSAPDGAIAQVSMNTDTLTEWLDSPLQSTTADAMTQDVRKWLWVDTE